MPPSSRIAPQELSGFRSGDSDARSLVRSRHSAMYFNQALAYIANALLYSWIDQLDWNAVC